MLADCYHNSLKLAEEYGCRYVAFPSISTGVYHFPLKKASEIAVKSIMEFSKKNINKVAMVCFDDKTKEYYEKALNEYKNNIKR